jgi:hypothetical protein
MSPKGKKKAKKRRRPYLRLFSSAKRYSINNILTKGINQARRFDQKIGILIIEVNGRANRGLHKRLPGIPLSVELFNNNVRGYDYVEKINSLRYTILLPQTDVEGIEAAKNRVTNLARELGWIHVKIGVAVYPYDGEDAETLLERAWLNLSSSRGGNESILEPRLDNDDFQKLI